MERGREDHIIMMMYYFLFRRAWKEFWLEANPVAAVTTTQNLLSNGKSSEILQNDSLTAPTTIRYRQYLTATMPIVEKYEKDNLVRRILATPPPDKVHQKTHRVALV